MQVPSLELLGQSLLSGLFIGGLYGLLGLGLSLSWGMLRQINLAHFALAFLGAYLTYQLSEHFKLDPFLTMVIIVPGFFLIGLSALDADMQRNLQLLKERAWFDIPVVYGNNRRAILAVEKGTPGERAFAEAFTAWRQ